ncbi:MAG: RNA polymerase sigma factor [Vicinamibacterales bacterium]
MSPSNSPGDVKGAELELVGRIRAGDSTAFEALYRQHATRLYNLASRMSGPRGEADDLLQDIFLLAYRKIGSFRGESTLGTWLYRLAMNHCLDVLRNRQTRMGQQTESLDEPDAAPVASPVPVLGAVNRIDLERAIEALPPACRAAFLLHDVEGFGHQEVGEMLGVSEGTSKSQVHKARMRIRSYLAHGSKKRNES